MTQTTEPAPVAGDAAAQNKGGAAEEPLPAAAAAARKIAEGEALIAAGLALIAEARAELEG